MIEDLSPASRAAHRIAPALALLIRRTGMDGAVSQLLRFGSFLLGLGASRSHLLEAEVKAALKCIYRADPVICDVGANVGHWSQFMRLYRSDGIIYLFEPQASCRQAIAKLNLPGIEVIGAAVGETAGELTLYTYQNMDDMASVHPFRVEDRAPADCNPMRVPVVALDEWIATREIPFIDYLKLDIEGHEYFALKGARQALASKTIGALSFEFGCCNLNSRTILRDFWDFLSPQYDLFLILPNGALRPLPRYDEDLEYYQGVSNFCAVLKDHPYRGAS